MTRKIRFFGPIEIVAELEGPIFRPKVDGKVDTKNLHLRMRGEFRQIDIWFDWLRGPVQFFPDGAWSMDLDGGPIRGEYFRRKEESLKHLELNGKAFKAKGVYRDRKLNLDQVGFAAYGGRAFGRLLWDLNEKGIRLGSGLTGDTAYDYRLGFQKLELGSFMADLTGLMAPMDGVFSGLLEGRGRTLMLERMHGNGRMKVQNLKIGTLPRQDELKKVMGVAATQELKGIQVGNLATEWTFQNGELRLPEFESIGKEGTLSGSLLYNILTLEIGGQAKLDIAPAGMSSRSALKQALGPSPSLRAGVGGRVVEPAIQYVAGSHK